jgi:ankyrin repeat protein
LLLSRDADPNEEDDYGTTALGTFSTARSWTSTPFEQELNLGTWDKDSLPSSVQPADVDHVFAFLRNASVDQLLVDENQPWSTTGATFGFSTAMQNLAELTAEDRQQELPPSSLQPADDDPWESSPWSNPGAKPQMTAEDRQQEREVASLLLAAGANPFHESSPGRTPVTMAKADGMKELAVLLEYYGDVQALRAIGFAANRPAHIDQLFALNGIADMVFSFLVPDKVVPRILHK